MFLIIATGFWQLATGKHQLAYVFHLPSSDFRLSLKLCLDSKCQHILVNF